MTNGSPASKIETIATMDRLREMEPALDRLAREVSAHFFETTAFFIPWCEMASKLRQHPHFLAAWSADQRLIGFVPLCQRRDPKALFARRLAPPRIGTSPPFDILLARDVDQDALIGEFVRHLRRHRWIDITLPATLEISMFATRFSRAMERDGLVVQCKGKSRYVKVSGFKSTEEYLAQFKSKKRIELNRQHIRFSEEVEIVTLDSPDEMGKAFEWIKTTTTHSWKNKEDLYENFLPLLKVQLLRMCAEGLGRVWFAIKDGEPIAFVVEFIDLDGSPGAYYNAHHQSFNTLGPGMNLLQHVVRATLDSGVKTYKFWGDRDYLRGISTDFQPAETIEISRPGLIPLMCRQSLRLAARIKSRRKEPVRK